MGRLEKKVIMITGGARGQGRNHAVTFAREGASIAVCDLAQPERGLLSYDLSRQADLAETQRLVEQAGGRALAMRADVRDSAALEEFARATVERFGRIDGLCANAGIVDLGTWDLSEDRWDLMMSINLKGVWLSCRAVIPHMIAGGGGVIVATSSTSGLTAYQGAMQYGVAKHAVLGLVHHLAVDLAAHNIRVNAICPTAVPTAMLLNEALFERTTGGASADRREAEFGFRTQHLLAVPWVTLDDVSNALLWLVSDEARHITGVALPIDAGATRQPPGIPPEAQKRLEL
jgi:SDR family mycofactocin-dependent oxidoreductase